MSDAAVLINVEVAYALPATQQTFALRVALGTTAGAAVEHIAAQLPEAYPTDDLGVFGRRVKPDQVLEEGDRVELYRPLTADPKTVRRELALLGKSMGKKQKNVQSE
ncbi:MAG: RnfH family protein [Gammaproteobacteria bacterium]